MNTTLAVEIAEGKYDNDLDWLIDTIADRHKMLRKMAQQRQLALLKPGDRVRFTNEVRPLYLRGQVGVVQTRRGDKLIVDLEVPAGRYAGGVRTPADMVEPA